MNKILESHREKIENYINSLLCDSDENSSLIKAMKYSIAGGGKRIRPVLLLEFCRLCGGDTDAALPLAAAVECIHTYSLIHDDLPCMDNDVMRRGKPSCHVAFGEAEALLAGDALLTYAFYLTSTCEGIEKANALNATAVLSHYAGFSGMVSGQIKDMSFEIKKPTATELTKMCSLKTGALIKAACVIGCLAAGADEEKIHAAEKYADSIGLSFQIVDDILDFTSDEKTLGKPVMSDERNGKTTFVSLYGIDGCRHKVHELTNNAVKELSIFGNESEALIDFAKELSVRKN